MFTTINASKLIDETPPLWAVLQRQLIDVINQTPEIVMEKYVKPNGYMMWPPDTANFKSIDGLDDMYESFHNWPLFYALGGSDDFLRYSHMQFNAITEQASKLDTGYGHPMVVNEYEQGYDWMHQGEGYLFFYLLNLADPTNPVNIERSKRFAGFMLNEGADNYDYEHKVFKCCYLGSMGAGKRFFEKKPWYNEDWKHPWGLPYHDIPGVVTFDDLEDEEKALAMGEAWYNRLKDSDTVTSLAATSMVMNAFLHTGDEKYRNWILEYVGAWREQAEKNGGIIPDNRGPSGEFGECMEGKWYGGYYGWTWPHGFGVMADPIAIACENEVLLTGDIDKMKLFRNQLEVLRSQAVLSGDTWLFPVKHSIPGAVHEYEVSFKSWLTIPDKVTDNPKFSRLYEKDGWYEFDALYPEPPTHLWFISREEKDMEFLRLIRNHKTQSWEKLHMGYSKYQGGQDAMWTNYLAGGLPEYPEVIMKHSLQQVYSRVKRMAEDTQPPEKYSDAYLQFRNPVTVEGLVHLTMGGPMPLYNGGLLQVSVCWYDADKKRMGLPDDVAALVSEIDGESITVTLVNLHPRFSRRLIAQSGAFGEHNFIKTVVDGTETAINSRHFAVELNPASTVSMKVYIDRYKNKPAYQSLWQE